jgi:hypothetical protein
MTDRELLEFAAKASGQYHGEWSDRAGAFRIRYAGEWREWNPLTDDGDALRLAVKLNLLTSENTEDWKWARKKDADLCKSYRRAITETAAKIGKAMS